MVIRNSSDMEVDRIGAMRLKDASRYYFLCTELGYVESAVEDFELYQNGRSLFTDSSENVSLVGNRRSNSLDITNSIILDAFNTVYPFIESPHGRMPGQEAKIKKRLRQVKATGYPVPNYDGLDPSRLFSLYLSLKSTIFDETFKRGLKSRK